MFLDQRQASDRSGAALGDSINQAVARYQVEKSAQWAALCANVPGITYFATDLDPRSFAEDESSRAWLGRAELLLKAPAELRPGQAPQEVSFTLPVKVVLTEQDGELVITSFDFYFVEDEPSQQCQVLEYGPPKTIGWGPFEGLV